MITACLNSSRTLKLLFICLSLNLGWQEASVSSSNSHFLFCCCSASLSCFGLVALPSAVILTCRCASLEVSIHANMSPVPGCVAGCGKPGGSSATTKTNSMWTRQTRNSGARLCSPTWKGSAGFSDIIIRYPRASCLNLFQPVAILEKLWGLFFF